jgi:hypothetical protein
MDTLQIHRVDSLELVLAAGIPDIDLPADDGQRPERLGGGL